MFIEDFPFTVHVKVDHGIVPKIRVQSFVQRGEIRTIRRSTRKSSIFMDPVNTF